MISHNQILHFIQYHHSRAHKFPMEQLMIDPINVSQIKIYHYAASVLSFHCTSAIQHMGRIETKLLCEENRARKDSIRKVFLFNWALMENRAKNTFISRHCISNSKVRVYQMPQKSKNSKHGSFCHLELQDSHKKKAESRIMVMMITSLTQHREVVQVLLFPRKRKKSFEWRRRRVSNVCLANVRFQSLPTHL